MSNHTSAPDAKGAIRDLLQARPELSGVQVTWGWPEGRLANETIIVGDIPESTQSVVAMRAGRLPKTEEYLLDLLIRVEQRATDHEPCTRRAYELAAAAEDALGDDPTLGGLIHFAEWQSATLEEMSDPDGKTRISIITAHIHCAARIDPS
jgi:hypothetical protein